VLLSAAFSSPLGQDGTKLGTVLIPEAGFVHGRPVTEFTCGGPCRDNWHAVLRSKPTDFARILPGSLLLFTCTFPCTIQNTS
jgi:hypothetical protein